MHILSSNVKTRVLTLAVGMRLHGNGSMKKIQRDDNLADGKKISVLFQVSMDPGLGTSITESNLNVVGYYLDMSICFSFIFLFSFSSHKQVV